MILCMVTGQGKVPNEKIKERDDIVDLRKREDDARTKSISEDRHSSKHKDDNWYQRDREDRQRFKLSHDDTHALREREDRPIAARGGRPIEEKALSGNGRRKEDLKGAVLDKDYHHKIEGDTMSSQREEKRLNAAEKSTRRERSRARIDRASGAFDGQQVKKEKNAENVRKAKEGEPVGQNTELSGKRKHEDHSTNSTEDQVKGPKLEWHLTCEMQWACIHYLASHLVIEHFIDPSAWKPLYAFRKETFVLDSCDFKLNRRGSVEQESNNRSAAGGKVVHGDAEQFEDPPLSAAKHREEDHASHAQSQESRRGRSKLERWSSHKERDYSTIDNTIQPPLLSGKLTSLKVRPLKQTRLKLPKLMALETIADALQVADKFVEERDRHLDTVAKLRMRSERFKPPMPGEKDKDIVVFHGEAAFHIAASEKDIKIERPARKGSGLVANKQPYSRRRLAVPGVAAASCSSVLK
ncbi:hypothetical protein HPP92_020124 [Vanilla planifolia]|uniref:Uncharacterized protein n=1 Tax=Vanilla planifolia TaxID=51239 RepID=A0A835Q822_VANPL|nr:hypothetical protein HPP92_020124 [Vanilla planifolia]